MNIKSADLNFNNKIVIISGRSGQGKSAIIDSLALCLSSKKRSTLYSDYVRQGSTHAKVILDCIINNDPVNFNLQINLTRGTPFQMVLTHKNKTYKNTEATEMLQSFDIEYYADIIFSMQSDDFRDITQLSPTQRANYLQRLLNFDFVNEKEKLRKEIDDFNTKITSITNDNNLYEQLLLKEESGKETIIEIITNENDITLHKSQIEINQNLIAESQKEQTKINNLNTELNKNSIAIQGLSREENNLRNDLLILQNNSEDLKKADKEIEDLENQLIKVNKEIRLIDIDLNREEDRISDLNKTIKDLSEEERENAKIRTKLLDMQKLLKEQKCPHCGQPTENFVKSELEQFIKTELANHGHQTTKKEPIEKVISKFENAMLKSGYNITMNSMTKSSVEKVVNQLKTEKALKESVINTTKNKIQELSNKIENSKYDPLELLEKQNKLKELNLQVIALTDRQDIIKKELASIGNDYDISSLSDEIIKLTNIINEYESAIKMNNEILERNKNIEI
jgi:DNA repair exonuclease SbcCD ATPase subunit